MDSAKLLPSFFFYISTLIAILRYLLIGVINFLRSPLPFAFFDTIFSLGFRFYGLSPITIDLDDQTTVHFWASNHRMYSKPNLVMIHGYGGDARWQFFYQMYTLSIKFNLYIPDLLFFGRSFSCQSDRTDVFQAKSMMEGLKRLGVDRFSVYSISYGGFVGYRMAQMYPDQIEKVVIASSGVGCSDDDIGKLVKELGRDPRELLVPENPHDLRLLVHLSVYKSRAWRHLPDFFLQAFVIGMGNTHRKEKLELIDYLVDRKADTELPALTQETLLIWGDQDRVFPLYLAYQLQRHLGPKSRLEIIKDTGHAANIESPNAVNCLVTSFILGRSM